MEGSKREERGEDVLERACRAGRMLLCPGYDRIASAAQTATRSVTSRLGREEGKDVQEHQQSEDEDEQATEVHQPPHGEDRAGVFRPAAASLLVGHVQVVCRAVQDQQVTRLKEKVRGERKRRGGEEDVPSGSGLPVRAHWDGSSPRAYFCVTLE